MLERAARSARPTRRPRPRTRWPVSALPQGAVSPLAGQAPSAARGSPVVNEKTPAASLAPARAARLPRATPASRPHPSQHLTSERLPPPSRVSRAGKKENLPRKAPSHSVDQSVPSVGGAVEASDASRKRKRAKLPLEIHPAAVNLQLSSSVLTPRFWEKAETRAVETLGSLSPASRKSDRDRRGASRLAVTVPDLLGAGVSGVSGVSAVSGLTQMDVPSPTVTRGGDSGSPSARQSRGAPTAATAPSPRSRLARTKSRSEATDLASAVGTRTAPVKKRRPPRLLLVSITPRRWKTRGRRCWPSAVRGTVARWARCRGCDRRGARGE